MAFLGTNQLKTYLRTNEVILDENSKNIFDEKRIEQAAYALSLGSEVYRTDNKDRKIENLDTKNRTIEINPGQFALLMTHEFVHIPVDKLAFISIKAKHKLKGLVNVSGFHVDPGFKGRLLFSVYNAGPSTITLETQKPYFLIWFAELVGTDTNGGYNSSHQGQKNINIEYIDILKNGDMVSPNELNRKIEELKNELDKETNKKTLRGEKSFWALSIILGIVTAINFALWNNRKDYENGYQDAQNERELRALISKIVTDSVSLQKKVFHKGYQAKNDKRGK